MTENGRNGNGRTITTAMVVGWIVTILLFGASVLRDTPSRAEMSEIHKDMDNRYGDRLKRIETKQDEILRIVYAIRKEK